MARVSTTEGGYGGGASVIHTTSSHSEYVSVPDSDLLFRGDYHRAGPDLVLTGHDGRHHIVPGYFASEKHAALVAPSGASLSADVVDLLAGSPAPGQYAQAQPTTPPDSIGKVEKIVGDVTVVRNGVSVALHVGDAVFKSDVIVTGGDSSAGITFPDGTVLDLVANSRMALNEYSFEPNGANNGAVFTLVEGTFGFVAGQVAQDNHMSVVTPVATMGIRGTAGIVRHEFRANAGDLLYSFLVLDEIDIRRHGHHVGAYEVRDNRPDSPTFGEILQYIADLGYVTSVEAQGSGLPPIVTTEPITNSRLFSDRPILQDLVDSYSQFNGPGGIHSPGSGDSPNQLFGPQFFPENGNENPINFIGFTPTGGTNTNAATTSFTTPPQPTSPLMISIGTIETNSSTHIQTNNIINQADAAVGVIISGTASGSNIIGQTITVEILSGSKVVDSYTTTVQPNDTWSVNVTNADAKALTDGIYTVTASVGNPPAQASQTVTVDETSPTIAITQVDGNNITSNVINQAEAAATVTISGTVSDALLNGNDDIAGQTVTVTLNGKTYTGTVQANDTWSVDVSASDAKALIDGNHTVTANVSDQSGNLATATQTVTVDTVTPSVGVTVGSSDVNLAANTALVTFTFSEATSDFKLADTTAVGGVLSNLATTDGGLTYTATFTANANTDISNGSVSVTAGTWHDTTGNNPGTGATSTAFVVDTVTPSVGVTVGSSDVNLAANTALVTFTFSEATSDFKLADTTAVGGVLSNLATTDGGLTYTATFTANANTDISNGSVSVTAGTWHDTTGNNPGTGATSTAFVVDTVTPSVGVAVGSSDVNLAANTALVTFTFSEATSDFKLADTTAVGGVLSNLATTDGGLTYTATFTANANTDISNGSVSVTAGTWHDTTGNNPGTGATSTAFVVDTVTPSVGVTVGSSDVNLAANTALVTFTFSEATSDFKLADTTAVGGVLSNLATTDGGLTYTATFTANANTDISNGSVSVTAGTWHDTTGNNPGTGATSTAFVVDTVTPSVGVTVGSSDVNLAANTALVTFTFSEATSDFKLADTTAVGGVLSNLATTDGGLTYTATFTANANTDISNGSVSVTAGTWHDTTGNNPGTGATSTAFVVDTVTPSVGVTVGSSDVNLAYNAALVTFTFSEATSDFKLADTTAVGGVLSNLATTDGGLTYTATFTANANTDISNGSVSVTAGTWHDTTGNNPGTGATSTAFVVDTVTPSVGVTVGSSDVNLAYNAALVTFTFSEATSDFKLADTTAVGGVLSNLKTTDGGLTYTATFTANANTDISNGSVSVTAGTWHEANGNPGTGATSTAFVVDTVAPKVAFTSEQENGETWTLAGTYSDVGGPGVQSVQVQLFVNGSASGTFLGTATLNGNGTWNLTTAAPLADGFLTFVAEVTDKAGNVATASVTVDDRMPAGVAGSPINLALTDPSGGQASGPITLTFTGVPSDWSLNQGTNLGNGTWTVETNDLSALTVMTAAAYSGAMVLGVTETWTNANGTTGTATVADNVEAYAPGTPIFALSGNDTLTGAGGNNEYVFAQPIGNDTIYNFNAATDKIDLIGFANIASFNDIKGNIADDGHGDTVITIGAGETITLQGVSAASLTAADFVFNQTPVVENAGNMVVSDGAVLPLSGTIDNTGTIALNSTGDQTELQIVGDGVTLQGGGQVTLSGAAVIIGTGSAAVLTNVDNTISGAGQIGSGDGTLTLVNETHGTIDANVAGGTFTLETGTTITNNGVLEALNGGTLQILDPVTGSGSAIIEGGTMIFGAQSNMNVAFENGVGTPTYGELVLGDAAGFSGQISGFVGTAPDTAHSDAIDLEGINYNSSSFSETYDAAKGLLTVTDGSHSASLTFDNFDGTLSFASDGNGGTLITDPPATRASNPSPSVSVGGPGNDNFVFHPGIGADTVANFNPQDDTIELDHFANVQNVQQLAALIGTDAHGDAVIELGHNDSITLPGVTQSYLQAHLQSLVHLG